MLAGFGLVVNVEVERVLLRVDRNKDEINSLNELVIISSIQDKDNDNFLIKIRAVKHPKIIYNGEFDPGSG